MIRKLTLPLLALGMMAFSVFHVFRFAPTAPPPSGDVGESARSPFPRSIAATGMLEAASENIPIGTPVPGIVFQVNISVGQKVAKGDVLFKLDDRQALAELKYQEANLASALAQLKRLENLPRPEELPAAEARVREAQTVCARDEDHLKRAQTLMRMKALSQEALTNHQQAYNAAKEQLARAQADLSLLKAGAWVHDKEVARAAVAGAGGQLEKIKTELIRLTVLAPIDGIVLQVKIHPGEYINTPPVQPLVLLGEVQHLHLRICIDEHDIPRFRTNAPAKAMLRGLPQDVYPLTFVRVEPYLVPKRSLTGDVFERVDTRVLQVIYAIEPGDRRLYVGQLMDVFCQE